MIQPSVARVEAIRHTLLDGCGDRPEAMALAIAHELDPVVVADGLRQVPRPGRNTQTTTPATTTTASAMSHPRSMVPVSRPLNEKCMFPLPPFMRVAVCPCVTSRPGQSGDANGRNPALTPRYDSALYVEHP